MEAHPPRLRSRTEVRMGPGTGPQFADLEKATFNCDDALKCRAALKAAGRVPCVCVLKAWK